MSPPGGDATVFAIKTSLIKMFLIILMQGDIIHVLGTFVIKDICHTDTCHNSKARWRLS